MKIDKTYRSRRGYTAGLAVLFLLIFFGLGGWVVFRAGTGDVRDPDLTRAGIVLMALGLPFIAYSILLMLRGSIRLDSKGIAITKALRTRSLPYKEIDRIEVTRRSIISKSKSYRIVTKANRKIFLDGDLFDHALLDDLVKVDAYLSSRKPKQRS